MNTGRLLETMLPVNDTVAGEVRDEALATASYASRVRPNSARVAADRSRYVLDRELAKVQVEAPPSVTLSSETGPFTATVTNGLDQRGARPTRRATATTSWTSPPPRSWSSLPASRRPSS